MSKKVLRDLFLFSDVPTYNWYKPESDIGIANKNYHNKDFVINRNQIFFKYLTTRKDGHVISKMLPTSLLYIIIALFLTLVFSMFTFIPRGEDPAWSLNTYFIANSILYGHYLLIYLYQYWRNYDIIKKFREIKKDIKRRKHVEDQKEMKEIADDIIDNNIKLMRKLKLRNLEGK